MKSGVLVTSRRTACGKSSQELIQRLDLAVGHQVQWGDEANTSCVGLFFQTQNVPT